MRLFIDMDGTVAKFYEAESCLERSLEPGYFRQLNRYENVVAALEKLALRTDISLYVLSAVYSDVCKRNINEKLAWLEEHMPNFMSASTDENNRVLFSLAGQDKAAIAAEKTGVDIGKDDFLLDDYNLNLERWRKAGGTAIKLVNEINDCGHKGPLWDGARIRYDWSADRIYSELLRILKLEES